jgi:hypothetical protein
MRVSTRSCSLLLTLALSAVPLSAQACGEGMFNTGKGLSYQSYLAPRPAAVLVFADPAASAQREEALYAGLKKAGHSVTVVRDVTSLQSAMREHRYDVVISALDGIDAVTAAEATQAPALLPVVARAVRNSPEVKNRFNLFLIDGASLGQYLKAINKMVGAKG